MTIQEIRALTNLSQTQFCEKYRIPLPTLRKWEQDKREPPDYLVELLEFKVKKDMEGKPMITFKTKMEKLPENCKDCTCHWCRLPLKNNKYEPELKKQYEKKRHEECPLIES